MIVFLNPFYIYGCLFYCCLLLLLSVLLLFIVIVVYFIAVFCYCCLFYCLFLLLLLQTICCLLLQYCELKSSQVDRWYSSPAPSATAAAAASGCAAGTARQPAPALGRARHPTGAGQHWARRSAGPAASSVARWFQHRQPGPCMRVGQSPWITSPGAPPDSPPSRAARRSPLRTLEVRAGSGCQCRPPLPHAGLRPLPRGLPHPSRLLSY